MSTQNRPTSLILTSNGYNQTPNEKRSKSDNNKKDGRSSSSSIDSTGIKNSPAAERNSIVPAPLTTTPTTTTTTDSEISSDRDDQAITEEQDNKDSSRDTPSRTEKNFLKLFKKELDGEKPKLLQSYVCAYQGDILLQGKMYITDRYLCFHSRIISYVTRHVYPWSKIERITKERVAFIFPTAIGIQLKNNPKKSTYASFLTRDQAFERIVSQWKIATNEPNFVHFSCADDDEFDNEGTLKANGVQGLKGGSNSDFVLANDSEDVLQMYLKENIDDQKRLFSVSSKSSDEKSVNKNDRTLTKKQSASNVKEVNGRQNNCVLKKSKSSSRTRSSENKLTNNGEVENGKSTQRTSVKSATLRQRSTEHRTDLSKQQNYDATNSTLQSANHIRTTTAEINSTEPVLGLDHKSISTWNKICDYFLSFYQQIQSYPMKTSVILLLFLLILIFHAFYLIQLAYKIEDRLQSLYRFWSPSSIKNSFSTISMKSAT